MKKQKFNYRSAGFAILLLLAMLAAKPKYAGAQSTTTENKLLKYELSIDLVPVIDQGQFGKVTFKISHFKDGEQKGAYRIGVLQEAFWHDKLDRSNVPDNVGITPNEVSDFKSNLSLGYEKYKNIGHVKAYFGVDIIESYNERNTSPHHPGDNRIIYIGVCPFAGIKHYLYKNKISTSLEFGWENTVGSLRDLNPNIGSVNNSFSSVLRIPYSFTINYHF